MGLDAALVAAGADEVVAALPAGLDTVLDERGRSLSGGQRQRLALARALAADPPVLVLHDPTTAVDTVTESRVAEGLRAFRRDRTTIVVTTSPALLAVTDRVVLLDEGAVTAQGTHTALVAEHSRYRTAVLS
jgi:putative ABC transport system ATP-binding protein